MNNMANGVEQFSALEIARTIAAGDLTAIEVLQATIARIEATDAKVNAFTAKHYQRARAEAQQLTRSALAVKRCPRWRACRLRSRTCLT